MRRSKVRGIISSKQFLLGLCLLFCLSAIPRETQAQTCASISDCLDCSLNPSSCTVCKIGLSPASDSASCYIRAQGYYKIANQRKDVASSTYEKIKSDVSYYFGLVNFWFLKVLSILSKIFMYHLETTPSRLLDEVDSGLNYLNYIGGPVALYPSMAIHPYVRSSYFPPSMPPNLLETAGTYDVCIPRDPYYAAGLKCSILLNYGAKLLVLGGIILVAIIVQAVTLFLLRNSPDSSVLRSLARFYGVSFIPVMLYAIVNELFGMGLVGVRSFGESGVNLAGFVLSVTVLVLYGVYLLSLSYYLLSVCLATRAVEAKKNLSSSKLRDLEVSEKVELQRNAPEAGVLDQKDKDDQGPVKHIPAEAQLQSEADDKQSVEPQNGSEKEEEDITSICPEISKFRLHKIFNHLIEGVRPERLSSVYILLPAVLLLKSIAVQLVVYFIFDKVQAQLLIIGFLEAIGTLLTGLSWISVCKLRNVLMMSNGVVYTAYIFLKLATTFDSISYETREGKIGAVMAGLLLFLMFTNTVYVLVLLLHYLFTKSKSVIFEWRQIRALSNKVAPVANPGTTLVTEGQELAEKKLEESHMLPSPAVEAEKPVEVTDMMKKSVVDPNQNPSYGTEKFNPSNIGLTLGNGQKAPITLGAVRTAAAEVKKTVGAQVANKSQLLSQQQKKIHSDLNKLREQETEKLRASAEMHKQQAASFVEQERQVARDMWQDVTALGAQARAAANRGVSALQPVGSR